MTKVSRIKYNKVSKQVREQAALICAIAASGPFAIFDIIEQVDALPEAKCLAGDAYRDACLRPWPELKRDEIFSAVVRAEAEAMIRCGWVSDCFLCQKARNI